MLERGIVEDISMSQRIYVEGSPSLEKTASGRHTPRTGARSADIHTAGVESPLGSLTSPPPARSRSCPPAVQSSGRVVKQWMDARRPKPLRVFICGAHSTGKTTLFENILRDESIAAARSNGTREILRGQAEVARPVIRQMCLKRAQFVDVELHPRVFEFVQHEISRHQCRVEAINDRTGMNFLYDRGIDPVVYAWMFLGDEAKDRLLTEPFLQQSIQRYRESVVFVMTPCEPCVVDDGFRLPPSMSELMAYTDWMKRLLVELSIPFHIIDSTDQLERTRFVIDIIRPLLLQQPNDGNILDQNHQMPKQ